ncbi:MAG: hypothetical protein F6K56_00855 [Moorea sp. SIO3G5]|nr:hypothetical protein [Moorena sp. SIO3G5]
MVYRIFNYYYPLKNHCPPYITTPYPLKNYCPPYRYIWLWWAVVYRIFNYYYPLKNHCPPYITTPYSLLPAPCSLVLVTFCNYGQNGGTD